MANEIQVSAALNFTKFPIPLQNISVNSVNATVAGSNYTKVSQTVPTAAGGTALALGGIANPGWCMLINRDTTNFVTVLTAVSGTAFGRILPGEPFMLRFDVGITQPAVLADTASVLIEGLVIAV